jgi:hypothetical protein
MAAQANSSTRPYLEKPHHKKRDGGVVQVWDLNSNPSNPPHTHSQKAGKVCIIGRGNPSKGHTQLEVKGPVLVWLLAKEETG